jgi:hypothetical protein
MFRIHCYRLPNDKGLSIRENIDAARMSVRLGWDRPFEFFRIFPRHGKMRSWKIKGSIIIFAPNNYGIGIPSFLFSISPLTFFFFQPFCFPFRLLTAGWISVGDDALEQLRARVEVHYK